MTDFRALCTELVVALGRAAAGLNSGTAHAGDRAAWAHEAFQTAARAESALAQPAPPAEGEVGDEARHLAKELRDQADDMSPSLELFGLMHRAADLLEQRHAEPVPVSERLPGPEDCAPWPNEPDVQPWCWLGNVVDGGWEWHQRSPGILTFIRDSYTHWRPATALPLPLSQQETPND